MNSPTWDAEKNEIVMIRAAAGSEIQYDANLAFTVAFNHELNIVGGHDPVGALNAMAGEVERVLVATEAELRRLGLI